MVSNSFFIFSFFFRFRYISELFIPCQFTWVYFYKVIITMIQSNSFVNDVKCKYVCDGLRYMYVWTCIAVPVGFVHCVSIIYRDCLCTREREQTKKKIELFQVNEKKHLFIHQTLFYNFFLTISILSFTSLRLG